MVKVKSAAQIADAYNRAIGAVGPAYQAGINAADGWQASAVAGQGLYEEKMRQPETLARRATGIAKVSDSEWKSKALNKGAARIGPGMEASKEKRTRNFEPYRSALESVQLPARVSDPVANVQNRVVPIVQKLVETKRAQG
jgi:hypothetical protein